MSNWLYQYWFFCFKTAKHWGKGPLHWTHDLLEFEKYCTPSQQSLPATPQDVMETVNHHHNDRLAPTQDCRWLIHVAPVEHEGWYDSPRFEQGSEQDTENNWDEDQMREPIAARFRNALEHNDFCAESASKLPVAIPSIAKAAEKAPDELMVEAWAFCIMSRNAEEAIQIYRQARQQKISFHHIHPLHLIINYLDGYKSCCDILRDFTGLIDTKTMGELWLNEWGHTVLDSLMISILKSHSTATPGIVDGKLKTVMRFVGEEVDICGRWDADSPCLRQLFARGESVIPSDWKHKFCHTSVQTVIHCMDSVLERVPERCVTEEPSGLYSRQCFGCGTTLKLQPLHCLVLTAFNLARYAVDAKEDLFGMLACLLCMVSNGIDPTTRATVAVDLLLGPDTTQELCDHKNLTAAELAIELSILVDTQYWSATIQSGWLVFCGVLQLCEANHIDTDLDEHDEDSEFIFGSNTGQSGYQVLKYTHYDHLLRMPRSPRFRSCKDLATLWASMQAEVLSYRRLSEDMDWTSQYFSMEDLRIQLNSGAVLEVGYATKNLLKTHCICGRLPGFPLTILANATNPDIANLDVWDRATYS